LLGAKSVVQRVLENEVFHTTKGRILVFSIKRAAGLRE
jgi:hypothetical protein